MIPNMNPQQMQKMLAQMGIKSRQISASRVLIESDSERIVISEPHVIEITMQGQTSFQISGKVSTEASIREDDVKMVMEQAGCTAEEAKEALKKSGGNIAEAIIALKKE